jgi:hypothetical protein
MLDVLLATGLPGMILLAAVVVACARRSSWRDPTLVYGLGLALVGTANVLLTDASGSTAALGLYLSWFGATRRPTAAAAGVEGERVGWRVLDLPIVREPVTWRA